MSEDPRNEEVPSPGPERGSGVNRRTGSGPVEAYRQAVMMAIAAARVLATYDLPELLRAIGHADSIGPLLNPTLWIEKNKAMAENAELLRAALPLWKWAQAHPQAGGEE